MDKSQIIGVAQRVMGRRKAIPTREAGYIFRHGRRTGLIAMQLAGRVEGGADVDQDVLFAAGLFHDVGKGIEPHHETGALLARELLQGLCTREELDAIAFLIAHHNQHNRPDLPLAAKLIQDADIIDHHGAQAIWLTCAFNAYTEQGPEGILTFHDSRENADYQSGCLTSLSFEISRQLLADRYAFARAFIARLRAEETGELWSTLPADVCGA